MRIDSWRYSINITSDLDCVYDHGMLVSFHMSSLRANELARRPGKMRPMTDTNKRSQVVAYLFVSSNTILRGLSLGSWTGFKATPQLDGKPQPPMHIAQGLRRLKQWLSSAPFCPARDHIARCMLLYGVLPSLTSGNTATVQDFAD